jgi:hypothetical protein
MPSQKCNQCDTVKRCSMYVDDSSTAVKPFLVYLCRACAKNLGFQPAKVGRPSSRVSSKIAYRIVAGVAAVYKIARQKIAHQ